MSVEEVLWMYKIDGVTIKNPGSFKIERFNLTKSGRVASGAMTMELVAKKRKFYFTYEVISGRDLQKLLNLIDTDKMFFLLEYVENGISKSATVYTGAIPSEYFRRGSNTSSNDWYYKNVTFDLIER